MLIREPIPMTAQEEERYQALVEEHEVRSVTRRDPGEAGPLVVELADGTTVVLEEEVST